MDRCKCNFFCVVSRQWASYQIRKIAGCACAGNAGNVFPRRRFQRKSLVNGPGMHHGTCVTHVPWCMSGSFTCGDGKNIPGIPGACAPAILRIWQEAHESMHKLGLRIVHHYLWHISQGFLLANSWMLYSCSINLNGCICYKCYRKDVSVVLVLFSVGSKNIIIFQFLKWWLCHTGCHNCLN